MPAVHITSTTQFQEFASANQHVITFFWAAGSEPCTLMKEAVDALLSEAVHFACAQVEAEKVPELTVHLKVSSVPTTLFLHKGTVVDRIEGFEPALLFEKAENLKPVDLNTRLKQLTTASPVVLFMKGSPEEPKCGFSRRVVEALQKENIEFGTFDILTDQEVRQGLKEYSDWPTYPQLYVGGELLGGCDIILEMSEKGELLKAVQEAASEAGVEVPTSSAAKPLDERIKEVLSSSHVMLLMKGSPSAPFCGFSRRVVDALQSNNIPFKHFDILKDEEIRQGVKKYSDWPTYPQLYINGELVGGCDIITEMAGKGELQALVHAETS